MDEEDLSKYLTNLKHEVHHHKETLNNILVEVGWNPVTSDTVTEKVFECSKWVFKTTIAYWFLDVLVCS